MNKKYNLLSISLFILTVILLASCKKETLSLTPHKIWSPAEGGAQDIVITANCDWTISIDDDADWYTIQNSTDTTKYMSGKGDATLTVFVQPISENENRASSFTITTEKGTIQAKVNVSQNTAEITELQSISNLVFGVSNVAQWNTDFFGEIIEDSYIHQEFNPNDTATGFTMYFLDNGEGFQQDHKFGSTYYYAFTYNFDPVNRNLHIEFETTNDTVSEIYNASVLSATEDLFRFHHEWRANSWERADMKKIGTIEPQAKALLKRAAKKREGNEPIFILR